MKRMGPSLENLTIQLGLKGLKCNSKIPGLVLSGLQAVIRLLIVISCTSVMIRNQILNMIFLRNRFWHSFISKFVNKKKC